LICFVHQQLLFMLFIGLMSTVCGLLLPSFINRCATQKKLTECQFQNGAGDFFVRIEWGLLAR